MKKQNENDIAVRANNLIVGEIYEHAGTSSSKEKSVLVFNYSLQEIENNAELANDLIDSSFYLKPSEIIMIIGAPGVKPFKHEIC